MVTVFEFEESEKVKVGPNGKRNKSLLIKNESSAKVTFYFN